MLKITNKKLIKEEFKDLGFGTKVSDEAGRLINRDGSFNLIRKGLPFFESLSLYHSLISMSWWKFNFLVLCSYVIINSFFAAIYLFTGVEHLEIGAINITDKFIEAFFFSTQTFTTVGYGRVSPVGFVSNIIASFEALTGLMSFALATGLLYGRFARPNVKIKFSENAVIAPYKDINAFMFKLINMRKNQLLDVEVQISLSRDEEINGEVHRKFYPLSLERDKVNFFPVDWTIVHPIDLESPLNGYDNTMLEKSDAEFLVILKAFDDTFAQIVHTRTSYKAKEIIWGAKFKKIFFRSEEGAIQVDIHRLSETETKELN